MAYQTGTHPGFCSIKQLGVFLLPPGWDATPSPGYPQHYVGLYQFVLLGGKKYCKSKVSYPRTQHNVPRSGFESGSLAWCKKNSISSLTCNATICEMGNSFHKRASFLNLSRQRSFSFLRNETVNPYKTHLSVNSRWRVRMGLTDN